MGGTFVAEEWPEDRRKMGAGYMHTGYYFGFFLAALANYFIGANFGWRWMFVLGGTPALLVGWIQSGVHEPQAWQKKAASQKERPRMIDAFNALFTPEYRAHRREFAAIHRVDHRAVVRLGLRSACGDAACRERGAHGAGGGPVRVIRRGVAGDCHHHRMPVGTQAG